MRARAAALPTKERWRRVLGFMRRDECQRPRGSAVPRGRVVLLIADSIDQLKRTPGRYFMSIGEMVDRMNSELRAAIREPLANASA